MVVIRLSTVTMGGRFSNLNISTLMAEFYTILNLTFLLIFDIRRILTLSQNVTISIKL